MEERISKLFCSCALLLLLAIVSHPLAAQEVTGSISGVVLDPSGAGIPKAEVKAIQVETGLTRTVVSDGRVYEYFLAGFAGAEGKRGGEFYTPGSVVWVLVEMLEPFPEFLAEVREIQRKNLALEALRKLINGEVRAQSKRNITQAAAFSDRLQNAIASYHANAITTVQVLEELIQLAKDVRKARQRGEESGLSDEEIAFYDASLRTAAPAKSWGAQAAGDRPRTGLKC